MLASLPACGVLGGAVAGNVSRKPGIARDAFGCAEEQVAAGQKSVVEGAHQPVLQLLLEVDQDVAAGNQIEPRERRVFLMTNWPTLAI